MPNKIVRIARSLFQKVTRGDLTRDAKMQQQASFDVLWQRLLAVSGATLANGVTAYLPADGKVSYVSGDRSVGAVLKLAAGIGYRRDDSEADPDSPRCKPIHVPIDTNLAALVASNPTMPRIDRIYARPILVAENPQTVDIINPGTEVVTATAGQNQDERWGVETIVATGTPAGSPTPPPNPMGWVDADEIARVTVQAGSGSIASGDITDMRVIYRLAPDLVAAIAASAVTTAAPIAGNAQSVLEALSALSHAQLHAAAHGITGGDRLPYQIQNVQLFGAVGITTSGIQLQQTYDFSGRGGDSTLGVIALIQLGGAGAATVRVSQQGADVGTQGALGLVYDGGNAGAIQAISLAAIPVPALSGRTIGLNLQISSLLNGSFSCALLIVDFGRP